jgi:cytochrome c peroxidase
LRRRRAEDPGVKSPSLNLAAASLLLLACVGWVWFRPVPPPDPPPGAASSGDLEARNEPIRPLAPAVVDDPAALELGQRLFHDPRLSSDGSISCASCHDVAAGGDDGNRTSVGVGGAVGTRNAPTVLNAVHNFRQFWDGRAANLEEQAEGPLLAADEMGWEDWSALLEELARHPDLVRDFEATFGGPPTRERVLAALVAYESALVTPDAPFDLWLRG